MGLKAFIRRALADRQIQVLRGPGLVDFLRSRRIDLVLDVGANVGQFAQSLRQRGYAGEIVSFEPLSSAFARLEAAARADGRWSARKLALGSSSGPQAINESANSVFSSMLALSDAATAFDDKSSVIGRETVQVERLDDLFDEFRQRCIFLKVDTQGFEPAVLAGAEKSLPHILGVQLELPIEHLYQDSWSFEAALSTMRQAGFVPAQITPVNHGRTDPASAIEFDCVFRRA